MEELSRNRTVPWLACKSWCSKYKKEAPEQGNETSAVWKWMEEAGADVGNWSQSDGASLGVKQHGPGPSRQQYTWGGQQMENSGM